MRRVGLACQFAVLSDCIDILITSNRFIRARVADEWTVVGTQVCDLAVTLIAEVGGVVAGGGANIQRIGEYQRQ